MSDVVVIGLGNAYRRDDGVGPAVAAAVGAHAPEVRTLVDVGDPCEILDAWAGARLAVVIDAAVATPPAPGRVHRLTEGHLPAPATVSSHAVELATVLELGRALDRVPDDLVVFAVEVAETGPGVGFSACVRAAVPEVIHAVLTEIGHQGSKVSNRQGPR